MTSAIPPAADLPAGEPRPPRRSPRFPLSPPVALLALAAIAWLLWDMWPDVSYFLSPRAPIDLGDLRGYHLERARPNRLVRVAGATVGAVGGVASRGGERRRVVGLFGTNLAIDRPGGAGPASLFEGRLLPERSSADYAPFVAELRRQGWRAAGGWLVLRDGERPRARWGPPLLSLLLVALGILNLRALVRGIAA